LPPYETLANGLKEQIEKLEVVYRFDIDASEQRFGAILD